MTCPEFETIYNTHKQSIYLFAKVKLRGNHHDAEDTVSYVFMKLWEAQPPIKSSPPILTWLLFVANRRAIDLLRIKYRFYTEINNDYPHPDLQTINFVYNNFQLKEIKLLIDKLSPKYKLVFSLYFFNELSPAEICKQLGNNNQTVRNELCVVRKKISKLILT